MYHFLVQAQGRLQLTLRPATAASHPRCVAAWLFAGFVILFRGFCNLLYMVSVILD